MAIYYNREIAHEGDQALAPTYPRPGLNPEIANCERGSSSSAPWSADQTHSFRLLASLQVIQKSALHAHRRRKSCSSRPLQLKLLHPVLAPAPAQTTIAVINWRFVCVVIVINCGNAAIFSLPMKKSFNLQTLVLSNICSCCCRNIVLTGGIG
jgi:hypothetical protein